MSTPSSPVDSDSAHPRWHEIEDLLDELARASKSDLPASEFYRLLLARLVPALAASGGAVWTARDGFHLEAQLNLVGQGQVPSRAVLASHVAQLDAVLQQSEPRVVPPVDRPGETNAGGWLIFHPFEMPPSRGVLELVAPADTSTAASRKHVQVLSAVVELVEDFHRHADLRRLRGQAGIWRQYDEFAFRVHHSLDLEQTALTIANDARRVVGCDRVTVLVRHGTKFRALAASGVDSLERRSKIMRLLEPLAARAAAAGEPLWFQDGAADVPDEIQQPLDAFLDESHARQLAVVPLFERAGEATSTLPRPAGVLVAEVFTPAVSSHELRQRVGEVSRHAALALNNALVHSRLPLARLGRALARVRWLGEARQLPKTALVLALVAVVCAALALVPADFNIQVRGAFQPQTRRDVFASDDGVVSNLLVDHGSQVRADQPLVVLRKLELELEFRRLAGEMHTAEQKLASVEAERLADAQPRGDERRDPHQLAAEAAELKQLLAGLRAQQAVLEEQQRGLTLRSPIDGQVLSWNLKQLLAARPVERGQTLLTLGDLAGPWVLELDLPDDRTGHVLAARDDIRPDLEVSFVLASEPDRVYRGRIADVALAAELNEKGEPTVLVTVDFDKQDVAGLRPGATANAKIHCGRRSLGYVWLHDLFHYVQSLWW